MNTFDVISWCDRTGNMVDDWAKAGCRCLIVDLQHPQGLRQSDRSNIWTLGVDVRAVEPGEYVATKAAFAFPPCTHVAVSGARWFRSKGPRAAAEAYSILAACIDLLGACSCPWSVENPVSTFSTYWRKPDHTFHPWQYAGYLADPQAENYTKATCLWTGNGFKMPEAKPAPEPHRHDIHLMPPSADRADLRSVTPRGFAKAVFLANYREADHG